MLTTLVTLVMLVTLVTMRMMATTSRRRVRTWPCFGSPGSLEAGQNGSERRESVG